MEHSTVMLVSALIGVFFLGAAAGAAVMKKQLASQIKRHAAETDHYYEVAMKLQRGEDVSRKELLPPLRFG